MPPRISSTPLGMIWNRTSITLADHLRVQPKEDTHTFAIYNIIADGKIVVKGRPYHVLKETLEGMRSRLRPSQVYSLPGDIYTPETDLHQDTT